MQKPPLNAHTVLYISARGLNFGLSLNIHPFIDPASFAIVFTVKCFLKIFDVSLVIMTKWDSHFSYILDILSETDVFLYYKHCFSLAGKLFFFAAGSLCLQAK